MQYRFLVLLFLLFISTSNAVSLSSTDSGQALIFPYYSSIGGNQTLVQITKVGGYPDTALKLIFRNRQGEAELSFNLYLFIDDTWTAAVARVGDEVRLYLPDESCIAPQLAGNEKYAVVNLSSGYIEVLPMGVPDRAFVQMNDCTQVASAWDEGGVWAQDPNAAMSAPDAIIRGSVSLINVQEGTMYSITATALNGFSDIAQNSAPNETVPNLSTAHDAGTENGQTMSHVCVANECFDDSWKDPLDAVAAVLLGNSYVGAFTISPEIGASTEAIFTFPLRYYYQQKNVEPAVEHHMGLTVFDQEGKFIPFFPPTGGPIVGVPPPPPPYQFVGNWLSSLEVISFNDSYTEFGNNVFSDILREEHQAFFPDEYAQTIFSNGSFYVGFNDRQLTANSGNTYSGVAGIAYSLERYLNSQLTDPQGQLVRANYGGVSRLTNRVYIRRPQ